MPDIWIDPPNSGFRFGGSFCMRKQCACLRGGIGGGAVGRSGRGWTCGSVAGFCARCALAVCASLPVLCVRLPCRDAGLVCSAMRFLLSRLGFGLSLSLRFCRGVLRSVCARCLCVPAGLVCSFALSGRWAGLRGDAVLLSRLVLRSRLLFVVLSGRFALSAGLDLRFCRGGLPRFTPVFFPLSGKKRRLAVSCVPIPQVEIAIRAFSQCWRGYLPLLVHFGLGRFFMAIPTGYRGRGENGRRGLRGNGAGGAAFVRLYAVTLAL